jgi:Tol biopolymer transport system component
MGEVYRARDERLGRDIALKILPVTVADDADRLDRFAREARVLASLNHPNIAAIHGFEDATAATPPALVLELVEGPTLAQQLRQDPLPLERALTLAQHIAAALDAAHERGIVHRDLKPANVKITADGTAKVLDFGIAKVLETGDRTAAESTSTRTASGTRVGVVIGTPAYMSPEQARGEAVDRRADIWAFGCVLFEMLSGTRAFQGDTASEAITAVLSREPDWEALPAGTPTVVRRLLRRCLERDLRRRLRDIGDALADLEDASGVGEVVPPRASVAASRLPWLLVGLLAAARAATLLWTSRGSRSTPDQGAVRTEVVLPAGLTLVAPDAAYPLALSTDGGTLAFVVEHDGASELYVRRLSQSQPVRVASGSGSLKPFFSPDGRWLAFASEDTLLKVEVTGGTAIRLCRTEGAFMGGVWAPDDRIIWAARNRGLYSVAAGGGDPSAIPETQGAAWPHVTPDGKTLLFTVDRAAIVRMPVSGGPRTAVARLSGEGGTEGPGLLGVGGDLAQAQLVSSGFLVYGQSPGIVMALPIDVESLTPTGAPLPVADPVERGRNGGAVYFAVSQTGLLVYAPTGRRHRLMWVDRHGVETPLATDPGDFRFPALSPDDGLIAVGMNDDTRRPHVWLYDAARGTRTWLGMRGLSFAWSADGQSFTTGDGDLVTVSVTPGVPRRILVAQDSLRPRLPPGTNPYPKSWSRDGRYLLFQADEEQVWVLDAATGQSRALLTDPNSMHPAFSPDGRWIAYASTASGRSQILVRSFPELAHVTQVSIDGGSHPLWSQSGREIVYRAGDAVMSAAVDVSGTIRVGRPVRLFAGHYLGAGHEPSFTVTRDGSRFLMIKGDPASRLDRLSVVQHFFEAAGRRDTAAAGAAR